ncbi:hypothetical protein ABZ721_31275 [Streptomyces sp. NPDC006733]|uniref:hypothetical protein n=1 Tax=Streptomyces sp. NPDC006733 TaxID=3155460 RepID=UPI003407CAD9
MPWPALESVTPHDPDVRYGQKVTSADQREGIGYRDHQTERCAGTNPDAFVQVIIRSAPQEDIDALDDIHQPLTRQGVRPVEPVPDSGCASLHSIHHEAFTREIPLLGPGHADPHAAKRPDFTTVDFRIERGARTRTGPNGITSPPWATDTCSCPSSAAGGACLVHRGDRVRYFVVPVLVWDGAGPGAFTVTSASAGVSGPVTVKVPTSAFHSPLVAGTLVVAVGEFLAAYLVGSVRSREGPCGEITAWGRPEAPPGGQLL